MKRIKIKILLYFFMSLAAFIISGFVLFAFFTKRSGKNTLVNDGYISREEMSESKYYGSLLNSYDPEPNWKPGEIFGDFSQLNVSAQSAVLIELDSGRKLYEKNPQEKMKIASLVKIMTAVISLEHAGENDLITISNTAANIGENRMGISEGEVYSIKELLYGLILESGNDAAFALSEGVSGDTDTFVSWMNKKAQELGMKNTFFADPSGLNDSSYSTTEDLIKLTRYALKNPKFREIAGTEMIELTSERHGYLYLENQTNLLTTYPGVKGVKTGYTEEAGLCLVTDAINGGKELVGVVLNSIDRKGDMILMLDFGYGNLGVNIPHNLLD